MQKPPLRARYRTIVGFFARLTFNLAVWEIILPRLGLRGLSRSTRSSRYRRIAADFRRLAVHMGGVMIKVGQFLSTRLDVLPAEITDELSGLQDEVPAEDFAAIRELAEAELGARLETLFERFEPEPLASASLGQVHRARLLPNTAESGRFRDVVVKIQRPFIAELIDVDFAALRRFGGWVNRYGPIRKRVSIPALIEEVSNTTHLEIDYLAEGRNAETFAASFARSRRVHVPRVAWSRTTTRVLTLENVYAIKITDYDAITAAGIDRAQVADLLLDTYLKQIFEDGFFHADPHPGNLFVTPVPASKERKAGWKLTFVDFGMVGTVVPELRQGLREILIGIGTRDAGRLVKAYQTLGFLLPGADIQLLEQAEAQMFDRFWGMSMSELRKLDHAEMHQFAMQFRELMYSMPFQLPQNLLLLGRTIAILSGMCTGLNPEFNIWQHLAPYAKTLSSDQDQSTLDTILDEAGALLKELIALPSQAGRVLTRLERGEVRVNTPQVTWEVYRLRLSVNRLYGAVVFAAFLLAGAIMYSGANTVAAYIAWGFAALSLLTSLIPGRGRLPPRG